MTHESVVDIQAGRIPGFVRQSFQCEPDGSLRDIPVLPVTRLLIDLEVQEPSVDLSMLTHVILSDLGATLQIFKLAGQVYGNVDACPVRIEDCISDLGLRECMAALSVPTAMHNDLRNGIADMWSHSREIALHAQLIAEDTPDVPPEEAYLVGLCHAIGRLPQLLNWDSQAARWDSQAARTMDDAGMGVELARRWLLPHFVVESLLGAQMDGSPSPWPKILQAAHARASRSSFDCVSSKDPRRRFLHAV